MKRSVLLSRYESTVNVESPLRSWEAEPLVFVSDKFLEEVPESKSIWYESEDEVEFKAKRAKERAKLLKWIRKQMERNLTRKERAYIEYYFFMGLTLEEISNRFRVNPSSVSRGIRRAVLKLRRLKENDSITLYKKKMRRVGSVMISNVKRSKRSTQEN